MKKVLILQFCIVFVSCKHKYHCDCATFDPAQPAQGYVYNSKSYDIKDKSEAEGEISCAKIYLDEGNAIQGVNCDIK